MCLISNTPHTRGWIQDERHLLFEVRHVLSKPFCRNFNMISQQSLDIHCWSWPSSLTSPNTCMILFRNLLQYLPRLLKSLDELRIAFISMILIPSPLEIFKRHVGKHFRESQDVI